VLLETAQETDYVDVVALVNLAFRGTGPAGSWNVETGIIEGQRIDDSLLREALSEPNAQLLLHRDAKGALLATVLLELHPDGVWHLGLLTIRPDLQNKQLGRALLTAAEAHAKQNGAKRIRMTVVNVRTALIEWYERRGYRQTGEIEPFPYGDQRFGRPLRDDLHFVVLEKEL
jgi:ribosomal protein S18 acetylase RimI-like enzyme